MSENKHYDHEYRVQAVKPANEIGQAKAARELGIPKNTIYSWIHASRTGHLDVGTGVRTAQEDLTLKEELIQLRKTVRSRRKRSAVWRRRTSFWKRQALFSPRAV